MPTRWIMLGLLLLSASRLWAAEVLDRIDASAIESYYKEQLLPQLVRSGGAQISLAQASPKIRELLVQQQINQLLTSWLETLRSQAQIRVFVPNSSEPRVQAQ